ncbi:MAG TPA: hypothetical protein VF538_16795 [Pyrinomonadaceae bacterium]|jgi:hypothetical protein
MSSVIATLLEELRARTMIKRVFENIGEEFEKTSNCNGRYNCIAHAAEDCKRWWWPIPKHLINNDRYWPPEAPPEQTREAFITAFARLRYERCESVEPEEDYEKVALYVATIATATTRKGDPTHMARQLPCGNWSSKLGKEWDIRHDKLEGLQGRSYGEVKQILRRRKPLRIVKADEQTKAAEEPTR